MLDLILAIGHHRLILALFSVFAAELVLVRQGMAVDALARIGSIDL